MNITNKQYYSYKFCLPNYEIHKPNGKKQDKEDEVNTIRSGCNDPLYLDQLNPLHIFVFEDQDDHIINHSITHCLD